MNIVALMDVFTVLVFFFLAHSSDVAQLQHSRLIELPQSIADQPPHQTLAVTVTRSTLLLGGDPVASVAAVLALPGEEIDLLRKALEARVNAATPAARDAATTPREITIMADKSIPFRFLKKVMVTCDRAGFGRISLSVLHRAAQAG